MSESRAAIRSVEGKGCANLPLFCSYILGIAKVASIYGDGAGGTSCTCSSVSVSVSEEPGSFSVCPLNRRCLFSSALCSRTSSFLRFSPLNPRRFGNTAPPMLRAFTGVQTGSTVFLEIGYHIFSRRRKRKLWADYSAMDTAVEASRTALQRTAVRPPFPGTILPSMVSPRTRP